MRVGVEEALDEDLAVVELEQLPGDLRRSSPAARRAPGRPGSPRARAAGSSSAARGHAEHRRRGKSPSDLPEAARRSPPPELKSSSRRSESERCSIAAGMSTSCRSALRPAVFSAKSSSRLRSRRMSSFAFGPLHLDHDALPVLQHGAVHLADRPRGERLRLDRREDVLPRHAQLLLHHLDHLGLGERRDLILKRRQLRDALRRNQVRARGEDLAELGERRAELLERLRAGGARCPAATPCLGAPRPGRTSRGRSRSGSRGRGAARRLRRSSAGSVGLDDHDGAGRVVGDAVGDVAKQELLAAAHARRFP